MSVPQQTKYLIIGNSAAAIGAVEGIRQSDPSGAVTVLTRERHPAYARPFIVNFAAKKIDMDKMVFHDPKYLENLGANVVYGVEVSRLDPKGKSATLADGRVVGFEKLLIASGGKPIRPPIKGDGQKQVISFMTADDASLMTLYARETNTAVVIGGGLIGLKAAEALVDLGLKVVMVELADFILGRVLDRKAAAIMTAALQGRGVEVITSSTVAEITGKRGNVTGVVLKDGRPVEAGLVVVAIGVTPNMDFIDKNEIKTGRGIVVDEFLRTSRGDIYAAGDVAESRDIVTGQNAVIAVWPVAKRQGYCAGVNMAGGRKEFKGSLVENVLEFGGCTTVSYGVVSAPVEPGYEELVSENKARGIYKKAVLKDGVLVGAVFVRFLQNIGIYRDLIINKTDVRNLKDSLLEDDFGWKYFPENVRADKIRNLV